MEGRATDGAIPYKGSKLRFKDPYGPYSYKSEVVRYKSQDGASIEATVLTPETGLSRRPGLVFVHMWARDRETWWGLPEFLATYGYPSIYMDLRGHGNSKFPGYDKRITIYDTNEKYTDLHLDILPAIDKLNTHPGVKPNQLILVGASLGCPLGVLAVDKKKDHFIGMIHLSPSTVYFDVNCKTALTRLKKMPLYAALERTDKGFHGGKDFFSLSERYKTYYQMEHVGHGTDMIFRDVGMASVVLAWVEQIEKLHPLIQKIEEEKPLSKKK
jgi:pimeloyl-ACP methyl ester carboxylesterase